MRGAWGLLSTSYKFLCDRRENGRMDPAMRVSLPGCDVRVPPGDITLRLSVSGSGWFLDVGGESRQVLCGDVDSFVASLLKSSTKRQLGLAVSSVIPGLCLGPALNLAVDAMVSKRIHGEDGRTLIRTDERIAICSRAHSLRDHLAESRLRFGRGAEFPFMSFPTFRVKRNGESAPARFGRNGQQTKFELFTSSPQFLFYDLSPLHITEDVPQCAVLLAELFESDGPQYVERLLAFARACRARYIFPIISYHDVEKRRLLEGQGFAVTTVTKGAGTARPDFTFASLCLATPAKTQFNVFSCSEPIAMAIEIDRAYRTLSEMWRICGNLQQPRQLRKAWSILDELSAAPSTIATLETVRRDAPRVTTLGFAIEKLAYLDCGELPTSMQSSLNLRWPHMCESLKSICESLRKHNPVMERVVDLIINAQQPTTVLTRSDTAGEALRRDLMFEWGWKDDGLVKIGSAATLSRERTTARHIVAVGFNPVSRPQVHWSLLPETFDVVTYPHMLARLAEYQALVRRNAAALLPKSNVEVLTSLRGSQAVEETKAPAFDFAYSDLATQIASFASARSATSVSGEQLADLLAEEDMVLVDPVSSDPSLGTDSEPTSALDEQEGGHVVIHFAGGEEHRAPIDAVFAALPADSEEMVKLRAADLSAGDRIVLLSEDEHRSVYALIAERTRHLFPMNERALELWALATDLLRGEYPPNDPVAVETFCQRLEAEHCRRGRQSMRNWLNGRVFAPEATDDVEIMLRVAQTPGSTREIAQVVAMELGHYRNFRRTIGRAIVRRTVRLVDGRASRSRLDDEIDEVLELCDVRVVERVDVIHPNPQPSQMQLPI
jgi:hypothetical protein